MHTIQFKFPLSVGLDGSDTNPNNPPSRALSTLLANGKNHKAQTFCYLNTTDKFNSTTPRQWLGVFLHSIGDRILFFPGLDIPIDWIETTREGANSQKRTFSIDHFSAEPSRQRWHITAPDSREHINGGRMPQISGEDSYHWLGLSFQNHQAFLPLYKETYVTYSSPKSDVGRRMNNLRELEQYTTYVQVNIENQEQSTFRPCFLHLCFIISRPTAPNYKGSELLLPVGSPYLDSPLPNPTPNFRIWHNRIPLSTSWDIQAITMLLPGTISQPIIFTGPAFL